MSAFTVTTVHSDALLTAGLAFCTEKDPLAWYYPPPTATDSSTVARERRAPGVAGQRSAGAPPGTAAGGHHRAARSRPGRRVADRDLRRVPTPSRHTPK